ncbi:MAG: 50S ribosomal protein L25 [Candidatus Omnitrophica bacterium]|nr:50S ribosomal protein L25 [Candidatus Omnitrophota bacterium]
MEEIILEAEPRQELGRIKVKALRRKGFIPAVVYGQGRSSEAIKLLRQDVLQLLHEHRLESTVINLKIKKEKLKKSLMCLIKEIQYDPLFGNITHIDFNEISLTQTIKVNVPVVINGEAIGVKQEGGSLEQILWEVEIECLPTEIPKEISVDVSNLKLGESIHAKDITLGKGIKILTDPEAVVVSVVTPIKVEEVVAATTQAEGLPQEPEVIKEKKAAPAEDLEAEEKKGEK